MTSAKGTSDVAYVLHSIPYKETSLVVELFCRDHGRLPVVAKGAKRPHSALRSVLVGFQPIEVRFSGQSEVKTLIQAEWRGGQVAPDGRALFAAYYMTELLMLGLKREDHYPELFDLYDASLRGLANGDEMTILVRQFELGLLEALGYGLDWAYDRHGARIELAQQYVWVQNAGWAPLDGVTQDFSVNLAAESHVLGEVIYQVQRGQWDRSVALALKPVTRSALAEHVAPGGLLSRVWMEQLVKT